MKPRPKRHFGQHFLRDTGILSRIERVLQPANTDSFVEIGAGDGALSKRIAPLVARFLALEVDADQLPALQDVLSPYPGARAIHADVLDLDLAEFLKELNLPAPKTRLLGNLPYNIASEIIHRALRLPTPVADMTFMVQLEVAQRIITPSGSRAYGVLSVDCQHRAEVRLLFKVPPQCFSPRPKVMSAVIQLLPRRLPVNPEFDGAFDTIAKAAFAYRRKTLENSIRRNPVLGPIAGNLLEHAKIQGSRRPEELSVQEYEHLAQVFCTLDPKGLPQIIGPRMNTDEH